MKKITHSLFFTLFLVGLLAFTKSDVAWYPFESKPFGFKVEFPAKPIEKIKVLNTELGDLNLNLFEHVSEKTETEPALVYIASYIEYPAESVNSDNKQKLKELYKKVVDGMVTKVQGKLLKETIITLEGFEGVEARIDIKDGLDVLKARIFLVHNKLYMLETVTKTSNEFNKSIHKFMGSFKLLK